MPSLCQKNCVDSFSDDDTLYHDEIYPDDFTYNTMNSKISYSASSDPYDVDLTIPWDDQSDTNILGYNLNKAIKLNTIEYPNKNESYLLSEEYLEMVAQNFHMRTQELEAVSYPDIVEDKTFFYDCKNDLVNDSTFFYDCTEESHGNIHNISINVSTPTSTSINNTNTET